MQKFTHTLSRLRSYLVFDPLIFFYTAVLGACSLAASFFDRDGRMQHWFARAWSWLILKTSLSPVDVSVDPAVDFAQPQVYAANHISAMDIPVLYTSLPAQFRIVANKYLFSYPFVGWHLRRSGQIPIDRTSPRATFKSLHVAVDDLRRGLSVVIFPEGGRSPDGHIKAMMSGAFYLAIKAQVPIVPTVIIGTFEMLPMNTFHIKPRRLQLVVGSPIATAGLTTHDLDTLAERVAAAMKRIYYTHSALPPPA